MSSLLEAILNRARYEARNALEARQFVTNLSDEELWVIKNFGDKSDYLTIAAVAELEKRRGLN